MGRVSTLQQTRSAMRAISCVIACATTSWSVPADAAEAAASQRIAQAWKDQHLSPDARANAALAAMTVEEKVALLHAPVAVMIPKDKRPPVPLGAAWIAGVPRLGIKPVSETDASLGVGNMMGMRRGDTATALPSSLALAASWNPDLAQRAGAMIGAEARAKGFGVMLAGGANLVRDPRAGRNFEYLSEDPLLTGVMAGRSIAGIQSNHIVSTLKHFALNDQETGRMVYSVNMPEALMRESDLLALEIANEIGRPGAVMCSYNRIGGTYGCENRFLLTDVLRRDWGFQGFVMSDWGATHSTESIEAGLDRQSGYQLDRKSFLGAELERALASGLVSRAVVDTAARRILRTLFALQLVDDPPVEGLPVDEEAHGRVAQEVAEQGIVLLRNEGGVLPFNRSVHKVVVIGGHADVGVLSGGGSSQVIPIGGATLEVKQKGGGLATLMPRIFGGAAPLEALKEAFPASEVEFVDGAEPSAAAARAEVADVALVFAEKYFTEGSDAADLGLGDGQDELIEAVAKANPRTVVVLETGNPVAMPWRDHVAAILCAWYPGQRGAHAIARVLNGEVNPSGHLPVTWPASVDQLPLPKLPGYDAPKADKSTKESAGPQADRMPFSITYPEGSDVGYRWFDRAKQAPLYGFGYGLSYTNFHFGDLKATGGSQATARCTVTNTGSRSGTAVPQIYVIVPGHAKRLVGWVRVTLAPGESQRVNVSADPRLLANFDAGKRSWIIAPGTYRIELASSAVDTVQIADTRIHGRSIPANVPARH